MPRVLSLRRGWAIAACLALGLPGVSPRGTARRAYRSRPRRHPTDPAGVPRVGLRVQRDQGLGGARDGAAQPRARPTDPQPGPGRSSVDPRRRAQHRPVVVAGRGLTQPLGVTFSLTPSWAESLRSLARASTPSWCWASTWRPTARDWPRRKRTSSCTLIGPRYVSCARHRQRAAAVLERALVSPGGQDVIPWYADVGTPVFSRAPHWGPAGSSPSTRGSSCAAADPDRRPRHAAARVVCRL